MSFKMLLLWCRIVGVNDSCFFMNTTPSTPNCWSTIRFLDVQIPKMGKSDSLRFDVIVIITCTFEKVGSPKREYELGMNGV